MRDKLTPKNIVIIVFAVVVLGGLVAVYLYVLRPAWQGGESVSTARSEARGIPVVTRDGKCSDEVIVRASRALSSGNLDELSDYAEAMLGSKDSSKDLNCEYIATLYYLNIADDEEADKRISHIEELLKSGQAYNKSFINPHPFSVEYLRELSASVKEDNLIESENQAAQNDDGDLLNEIDRMAP